MHPARRDLPISSTELLDRATQPGYSTVRNPEPTDTESGTPANSESALDIAASISLTDEPLSASGEVREGNVKVIGISPERVGVLFCRLAMIFPLNVEIEHPEQVGIACEVYANLLSDIPADECEKAFAVCAKTLTRFPFPADIRAAAGKQ